LPEPPGFSIYLEEDDVEIIVRASLFEKAWALSTEELDSLTEYTLRTFQYVFQKVYNSEPETMPHWLVPASTQAAAGARVYAATCIDWDIVVLGNSVD
jgi:endoribonuclease Dicer